MPIRPSGGTSPGSGCPTAASEQAGSPTVPAVAMRWAAAAAAGEVYHVLVGRFSPPPPLVGVGAGVPAGGDGTCFEGAGRVAGGWGAVVEDGGLGEAGRGGGSETGGRVGAGGDAGPVCGVRAADARVPVGRGSGAGLCGAGREVGCRLGGAGFLVASWPGGTGWVAGRRLGAADRAVGF
ncbi:hypothetical protein [Streptomyces sp. NA02536]|uniref:hypothetical protein n=1 Tax=Streptomyces TaxID=1883 RepID=UPI00159076BD|nr:hypothetical protein [Streptomyces sp. NA02536]QKW04143.1 hypothetical protein HUT14_31910 [Streptomyces sp. NA02536]